MFIVDFLLFDWDIVRIEDNHLRSGRMIIRGECEIIKDWCVYLLDVKLVFLEVTLWKEGCVHAQIDTDMQQWRLACFFEPIVQVGWDDARSRPYLAKEQVLLETIQFVFECWKDEEGVIIGLVYELKLVLLA